MSIRKMKLLVKHINPSGAHSASVIFLHGSGIFCLVFFKYMIYTLGIQTVLQAIPAEI